ncbi:hypothetical protein Droror1_Dr00003975 [Drosera rotundifolia]
MFASSPRSKRVSATMSKTRSSLHLLVLLLSSLRLVPQLHLSLSAAFNDHKHRNYTAIKDFSYDDLKLTPLTPSPPTYHLNRHYCNIFIGRPCGNQETCCCNYKFLVCWGWDCCPLGRHAVCCKGGKSCCPQGSICVGDGAHCELKDNLTHIDAVMLH